MKRLAFTIVSAGAACVLIAASTTNQPSAAASRPAPAAPALSFDKVLYVSTGTLKHADKPAPNSSNAPATAVSATQPADTPATQTPPPQKRRKRGAAVLRYLDLDGDGVADSRDL